MSLLKKNINLSMVGGGRGQNLNRVKRYGFTTVAVQVNNKGFLLFLEKGLKCSCLPVIQVSWCKSELSVAFSERNILDC